MKLTVIAIGVFFFSNGPLTLRKQNDCAHLQSMWVTKKNDLIGKTNNLRKGHLLDHELLRMIVYPEYVSYDANVNSFEMSIIEFLYALNIDRFSTISIGPFQMQLKFIKTILDELPATSITDSQFVKYRAGGYKAMINDLDYLSKMESQWSILLMYEELMQRRGILRSTQDINNVIGYYNSGKITRATLPFSKITCFDRTYLEWSYTIANL